MILYFGLTVVGILGIILGLISFGYNVRKSKKMSLAVIVVIGIFFAVASAFGTIFMGYPVSTEDGLGRIVGIPFFVAFFDSYGADYTQNFPQPGFIGNVIFWFLVPQIILASIRRYSENKKIL